MGFWIFMLLADLLIPLIMIGFGRYFLRQAPKNINPLFGYRTSMSMKNKDTWEFAHRYFGKLWYVCGFALLPVTLLCLLAVLGKSENSVGTLGGALCMAQLVVLIAPIVPTELALRKQFDKNGNRRPQ